MVFFYSPSWHCAARKTDGNYFIVYARARRFVCIRDTCVFSLSVFRLVFFSISPQKKKTSIWFHFAVRQRYRPRFSVRVIEKSVFVDGYHSAWNTIFQLRKRCAGVKPFWNFKLEMPSYGGSLQDIINRSNVLMKFRKIITVDDHIE